MVIEEGEVTVGSSLISLGAVLAAQAGDAGFLVDFGGDGVFGVAEDAFEGRIEHLTLRVRE